MRGSGNGDLYQSAGYGSRAIGLGTHPVLLVVDFQTGFTDPHYPLGRFPRVHAAVERCAQLLPRARAAGVPIAFSTTAYSGPREMPRWKVRAVLEDFLHGHPCTAIDPRLLDPEHDFVFTKGAASAFFQSPLLTFLHRCGADTILLAGCTTSGCIRATTVDSFSHGFRTAVLEDCCGDGEREAHEANLRDVGRRYADVVSAEHIAKYFETLSGVGGAASSVGPGDPP